MIEFILIISIVFCVIYTATFLFFLKLRRGLKRALEKEKDKILSDAAMVQKELEEQKLKIAEANVNLMEQGETLESQKLKLAEANLKMLESNEIIERERSRSEALLLNILPVKVAVELKEHGKTEPESFDEVTVFFSDLVDFTDKASGLEPKVLINELNDIFTGFDKITKTRNCERIKTIGDAYLCVCGMPSADHKHAENILNAAIEMVEFLKKRNETAAIKWEIRVGIHTGKVVGGVVGVEKYIYDVFGDAINTASRMESHSEPMKINVSENVWQLEKDKFKFIERPAMDIKGKGNIKMYFLDGSVKSLEK